MSFSINQNYRHRIIAVWTEPDRSKLLNPQTENNQVKTGSEWAWRLHPSVRPVLGFGPDTEPARTDAHP
jgi:hypothetical protein